ncbi:MAG: serine/threonine protein kinase [Pirellulaceae bacterium]
MTPRKTVRYGGRDVPIIGALRFHGRVYQLLRDVGRSGNKRFWVYYPPGGFRQILVLPRGATSRQHLDVLQRLPQGNPNLPTILDSGFQGQELWVVTNWVRGQDLRSFLDDVLSGRREWPSPLEVIKLYRGLAHGLSQMHRRRRIIHGDIKPENLVLAREPNRLVMIDFGTAWMAERTTRRDPGDGESRYYSAPERMNDPQRRDDEPLPVLDARCDQFSATVVAYEMLTGVRPYGEMGGEAGLRINRDIYEPLYRPPSQLSPLRRQMPPRIWRGVDELLGRALKLDANQRFPSRQPWLAALDDVYCEMRRQVRFTPLALRILTWVRLLGDRLYGTKTLL